MKKFLLVFALLSALLVSPLGIQTASAQNGHRGNHGHHGHYGHHHHHHHHHSGYRSSGYGGGGYGVYGGGYGYPGYVPVPVYGYRPPIGYGYGPYSPGYQLGIYGSRGGVSVRW